MNADVNQYIAGVNEMIITCYKRSYKNRESLNELIKTFEKLTNIRKGMMLQFRNFPGDLSVSVIIGEISKVLEANSDNKLLEWTFDHYTDLFKFKAEALIVAISQLSFEGIPAGKKV